MRETLNKLDKKIYQAERFIVGHLFIAMSVVVFVDVLHRVFSRQPGRLSVFFAHLFSSHRPEEFETFLSPAIIISTILFVTYFAMKTRAKAKKQEINKEKIFLKSLAISASLIGLTQVFIYVSPQGIVWAPYFGLICLLWIGFIGASMATHTNQHLLLEMGEKLWPQKFLPYVRIVAAIVVGSFVLVIAYLGTISVLDHLNDWQSGPQAGLIPSIDWPKWLVYMVIPYAFTMMGIRFLGLGFKVLDGSPAPDLAK